MISIINSLYNSNQHIDAYARHIEKFSVYLTKHDIDHEFVIISNSPNEYEQAKLKEIGGNANIKSKIIVCPRESIYATWNRGVREAKFSNITFWNVDDIRFPEAVIEGIRRLDQGADIVYFPFVYKRYVRIFGLKILAKIKRVKAVSFDKNIFATGMCIGPFFITKKKVFSKIGAFDESFKIAGDFEWAVRAAKADIIFEKGTESAGIFTSDGNTLSGSRSELLNEENKRVLAK